MIVPVNAPVVTADGKGAATDAGGAFKPAGTLIHPGNWAVVRLVGETTGQNAVWTLLSDNGLPLDFANGALASMGLVLVAPGQRPQLTIAGATPLANVLAQFVGVMSPSLDEVLPYYLPSPNPLGISISGVGTVTISGTPAVTISGTPAVTISGSVTFSNTQIAVLNVAGNLLNTQQPPTFLVSFTANGPSGTLTSQNVTVPAATHELMIATQGAAAVDVVGQTTGAYYTVRSFPLLLTQGRTSGPTNLRVAINTGVETGYTVRVTSGQTANATVWVTAILTPGVTVVKTDLAEPIRVAGRTESTHASATGSGSDAVGTFVNLLTGPGNAAAITKLVLSGQGNPGGLFIISFRARGNVSGNTFPIADIECSGPGFVEVLDFEEQPWNWGNDSWVGATDGQMLIDGKGNGLATAFFACTAWWIVN